MEPPRLQIIRLIPVYVYRIERTLWDPRIYGSYTLLFRDIFRASLIASVIFLTLTSIITKSLLLSITLAITPITISVVVSRVFRLYVGLELDRDMPIVLSLLLPLARFSSSIADVVLHMEPEKLPFGLRFEVSRLKVLIGMGYDPVTALRILASTSTSSSFSNFIRDYLNAVIIGGSRTDIVLMFLRETIDRAREQWRFFFTVSRTVAEVTATLLVSLPVIIPLAMLSGFKIHSILFAVTLASIAMGIALLGFKPRVGGIELSHDISYIPILVVILASLSGLIIGVWLELLILLSVMVALEAYAFKIEFQARNCESALREALEGSRVGIVDWDKLKEARRRILTSIIDALLASWNIAGIVRPQDALAYIQELHEEVKVKSREAKLHGLTLAVFITASLVITLLLLSTLAKLMARSEIPAIELEENSIHAISHALIAVTPLFLLTPAVVYRYWLPTLIIPSAGTLLVILFNMIIL